MKAETEIYEKIEGLMSELRINDRPGISNNYRGFEKRVWQVLGSLEALFWVLDDENEYEAAITYEIKQLLEKNPIS